MLYVKNEKEKLSFQIDERGILEENQVGEDVRFFLSDIRKKISIFLKIWKSEIKRVLRRVIEYWNYAIVILVNITPHCLELDGRETLRFCEMFLSRGLYFCSLLRAGAHIADTSCPDDGEEI